MSMSARADAIRVQWERHGSLVLILLAAAMLLAAVWRLADALPFLMWQAEEPHPTDLHARHGEVARWFRGIFVDPVGGRADYPPASYVVLWPLLGWLTLGHARWLWGLTSIAALSFLAHQLVEASGATTRAQKLIVLLLPFSGFATSATMSVGQLGNHVLPMLLGGVLLVQRAPGRWRTDAAATVMLLFALVKPILSAPFFWIVCFASRTIRPIVLVTLGYLALTAFAVSFQSENLITALTGWLGEKPDLPSGHANLHKALASLRLFMWILPATAFVLLAFGWWVHRHRIVDIWILLGVAALVARLGFHHRPYDDVLILIPLITLFRMARHRAAGNRDLAAGALFALGWTTLHLPAQLFGYPPPVPALTEAAQAIVWVAVLIFLLAAARWDVRRVRAEYPTPSNQSRTPSMGCTS